MYTYPADFVRDEDAFFVKFPDIEGARTDAVDKTSAINRGAIAATLALTTYIDRGLDIPAPS